MENFKFKTEKKENEKLIAQNVFFSRDLSNSKISILEVSEETITEPTKESVVSANVEKVDERLNTICNEEEVEEHEESENIEEKDDNVFEAREYSKTKLLIEETPTSNVLNNKIDLKMNVGETKTKDNDDDDNNDYEELVENDVITSDSNNDKEDKLNTSYDLLKDTHHNQSVIVSTYSLPISSPASISPMILQKQQQQQIKYKQQQNNLPHARKFSKFKGRYMTDPLSAQQKDRMIQENENSYKLPKRNSLNDRYESQTSSSSPTSPNNQQNNQELVLPNENVNRILTKPMHGDSTSTLMSTDSGISSATYSGHQSTSIESIPTVPEYKLSEEEVDEIYEGFVKVKPNSENLLKKTTPVNEIQVMFSEHQHVDGEKRKTFYNNSNDYGELYHDSDDSKPNLIINTSPTAAQTKQSFNDSNKSPKWQIAYQDKDRDTLPIPLVVGQLNGHSDVNNNNLTNKLSPQVFNSFNLSSHNEGSNTSTFTKKFSQKFRYDGQSLNKLKTNKSSLVSVSTQNLNNRNNIMHHQSNENVNNNNNNTELTTSSSNLNRSINKPANLNYLNHYNRKNEKDNEENEIHLIASQKPSIFKLSTNRGAANNSFDKRCQTPVDYLFNQQYENNNKTSSNYNNDIYDSTIKSGNSSNRYGSPQQSSMFFNLLHTTPDAT